MLNELQRTIYNVFDDLRVRSLLEYRALAEEERYHIKKEILGKMIGLGVPEGRLLHLDRVNTIFPKRSLGAGSAGTRDHPWQHLHRNTAIYADHSLIPVDTVTIPGDDGNSIYDDGLNERTVDLLLQHRPLVELGKMSIIPDVVRRRQSGRRDDIIFSATTLEAVKVDLGDPVVKEHFLSKGKLLTRQGAVFFGFPNSAGLPLERIMEIIADKHKKEYGDFQEHFKWLMDSLSIDDDTAKLRHALRAVDEGIRELDAQHEAAKRKWRGEAAAALGSAALAVVLYTSDGASLSSFIASAFAGCAADRLISFIPASGRIPPDIRTSPFFIPWLVYHETQST